MSAIAITRVLLEISADLASRAATVASACDSTDDRKTEAERYEKAGDQAHALIKDALQRKEVR